MNWYKGIIVILVVTLVGYSAYLNDRIKQCEDINLASEAEAMVQREIAKTAVIVATRERVRSDSLLVELRKKFVEAENRNKK